MCAILALERGRAGRRPSFSLLGAALLPTPHFACPAHFWIDSKLTRISSDHFVRHLTRPQHPPCHTDTFRPPPPPQLDPTISSNHPSCCAQSNYTVLSPSPQPSSQSHTAQTMPPSSSPEPSLHDNSPPPRVSMNDLPVELKQKIVKLCKAQDDKFKDWAKSLSASFLEEMKKRARSCGKSLSTLVPVDKQFSVLGAPYLFEVRSLSSSLHRKTDRFLAGPQIVESRPHLQVLHRPFPPPLLQDTRD